MKTANSGGGAVRSGNRHCGCAGTAATGADQHRLGTRTPGGHPGHAPRGEDCRGQGKGGVARSDCDRDRAARDNARTRQSGDEGTARCGRRRPRSRCRRDRIGRENDKVLKAVADSSPRERRAVAIAALTQLVQQGHGSGEALAKITGRHSSEDLKRCSIFPLNHQVEDVDRTTSLKAATAAVPAMATETVMETAMRAARATAPAGAAARQRARRPAFRLLVSRRSRPSPIKTPPTRTKVLGIQGTKAAGTERRPAAANSASHPRARFARSLHHQSRRQQERLIPKLAANAGVALPPRFEMTRQRHEQSRFLSRCLTRRGAREEPCAKFRIPPDVVAPAHLILRRSR